MRGAALLIPARPSRPRGPTGAPDPSASPGGFPSALHLFASLLVPDDDRWVDAVVRWARAEAARAVHAGRSSIAGEEALAYRLLYAALRADAASARAPAAIPQGPHWAAAFAALGRLRHRQRAALAAYFCCGLSIEDTARALRLTPAAARRVVEAGIASIGRRLVGPADARRALRSAGARLTASRAIAPTDAAPRRSSRGRSVVEVLIAAPLAPSTAPPPPLVLVPTDRAARRRTVVDVLLAPAAPAAAATATTDGRPAPARRGSRVRPAPRRRWLVAVAVVLAWLVASPLPGMHGGAERRRVPVVEAVVPAPPLALDAPG